VAWSERAKIGEEPRRAFKVFHCLQLFINTNKNAALQRKRMEIAMFLPIATGQFYVFTPIG
jgi:hypothetical protein